MRLRAIGADRLAPALADAQMINDPGPAQEHDQRAGANPPAGAEGDVAKNVQGAAQPAEAGRKAIGELNQPVEHSIPPIPRLHRLPTLPGKRFSSAFTIVFILEPSDPLIMIASPARIAATTSASRPAELSA